MERRDFLKRLAAAAAVAAIAPARLLNADAIAPRIPPVAAPGEFRNIIRVRYWDDAAGGERWVERSDEESVLRFGPRAMEVRYSYEHGSVSSHADADALARMILDDIGRPALAA